MNDLRKNLKLLGLIYSYWLSFYGFVIFLYADSSDDLMNPATPLLLKLVDEMILTAMVVASLSRGTIRRPSTRYSYFYFVPLYSAAIIFFIEIFRSTPLNYELIKNFIYIALFFIYVDRQRHLSCDTWLISVLNDAITAALFTSVVHFFVMPYDAFGGMRMLGAFSNPNTTGFVAVANIAITVIANANYANKSKKALYIAVSCIATIMTMSVAAIIQLLILFFFMAIGARRKILSTILIILLYSLAFALALSIPEYIEKVNQITTGGDTVSNRQASVSFYLSQLQSPWQIAFGIETVNDAYYSDSGLLNVLHGYGLFGLFGYILLIFLLLVYYKRSFIHVSSSSNFRQIWFATLGFFVSVFGFSWFVHYQTMVVPSLLLIALVAHHVLFCLHPAQSNRHAFRC